MALTTHFPLTWTEARALRLFEVDRLVEIIGERQAAQEREDRRGRAKARGLEPAMT